jgi:FkbM family methyltransferase
LNNTGFIDQQIIQNGEFEPMSTAVINRFVMPGDTVLDIGANIGYYTVMFSNLVGDAGKVVAFEPTNHYLETLHRNIEVNRLKNVEVLNIGLSNKICEMVIDIGPSSATLHSPIGFDKVLSKETIRLTTLTEYARKYRVDKIDFIKIDIDGHEPIFFEGAWPVLDRLSPVILCEVSHLHYLQAGYTAWEFYTSVKEHGYLIYDEATLDQIHTKESFLRRFGNFDMSANIILSKSCIQ